MLYINIFLGVTTFITSFLIAFFVLLKNSKNLKNRIFFVFSISLSFWPLFASFANYARAEDNILLWSRLAMIGPPIAIAAILHFSFIFNNYKKLSKLKLFLIYFPVVIVEALVPTKYNIRSVHVESWGSSYEPGILFNIVSIMIVVYLIFIIYNFSKKYRNKNPLIRMQIKYFLFAVILAVSIGLITNFILPFVGNVNKYTELGPSLSIILFNSIIAYSIVRYRLFDIRLIIQKSISYTFSLAFLLTLYFSLIIIFENFLRLQIEIAPITSAGIIMIFGVITIPSLINFFNKITQNIFFKNKYDYAEVITQLSNAINKNIDLDSMLEETLGIVSETLQVDKLIFLLYDKELKKFIPRKKIGFSSKLNLELERNDSLVRYLSKEGSNVMWKELEIDLAEGNIQKDKKNLIKKTVKKFEEWGVYLCQPIIKNNSLVAVICLGDKKSKDSFTKEDLKLINAFNNQIVVAIENFLVYEDIKHKKEQLEKSMKLMVGRELKMIELKKEIKDLKERINKK